jgi:hypothetical protein
MEVSGQFYAAATLPSGVGIAPGTNWLDICMGPRACLDVL